MDISRIKITKVNGIYNYDIPIANNTLILVGENGTGKSTVLSILNLIISRQWEKITEYKFKDIEIDISEKSFKFTKKLGLLYCDGITVIITFEQGWSCSEKY